MKDRQPLSFGRHRQSGDSSFSSLMFGKVPPQARDLEEAILGAMLLEKDCILSIVEILKKECFYVHAHELIFDAMVLLFGKSSPVDLLTVTIQLKTMGSLEDAGGASYLMELTSRISSAANAVYHAHVVYEKYVARELIKISSEIIKDCYNDETDIFELHGLMVGRVMDIIVQKKKSKRIGEVLRDNLKILDDCIANPDKLRGIPCGLIEIDRKLGGFKKGNTVVIAARPSMGKSVAAKQIAMFPASLGIPTAVFTLEAKDTELGNRVIADESNIDNYRIQDGKLQEGEMDIINKAVNNVYDYPCYIDDSSSLNWLELRAKLYKAVREDGIQLAVIDYIQLMQGKEGGNREQEIASITRMCKNTAKELDIVIVELAQLNRGVENRSDKRPILADLRESGAIEQDANVVIFLYRPAYYEIHKDEKGNDLKKGHTEWIVAKNRDGALGIVKTILKAEYSRFEDYPYDIQPSHYEPKETKLSNTESNLDSEVPF